MSYTTTLITHDSDYFDHQDEYQNLFARSVNQPFFMLPQYQNVWWKHLKGGELQVIEVRKDGILVGLAPLFLVSDKKTPTLEIIGSFEVSDYLDLLLDKVHQKAAFEQITTFLIQHSNWNTLFLASLPHTSHTVELFKHCCQQQSWHMAITQQDVSPVITLPQTWEEYLQQLTPSHVSSIKRSLKEVGQEDDIEYEVVTTVDQMKSGVSDFISLHKKSGAEKAAFWNPAREHFFEEMCETLAKDNLIKLYFMRVNNERAASLLIFDYQNEFLVYNSGFDAYRYGHLRVGNVIIAHTIQEAIRLGRSRYDFMRGDEPYKFTFGGVPEPVWDITIQR